MSVFAGRAVFPATFADPHGNGRAGLTIAVYRRLTYTDGVTVLGSTRLESATATFTSADEGKSISAENFPSGATIETYVSATEVDLSVEATAGGTGASFIIAGRQRSADLATVYTDRLKSETTSNPYVADVDGNTFPYVDPGDYDAVTIHGVVPFSAAPDHEDVETVVAGLPAHLVDAVDAHDASAISVVPAGSLVATTVQAALTELDAEKQPIDSDLTAIAALSTTAFGRGLLALADGAALAGSIPAGTYVPSAGDATVAGVKTFSSAPVVPDAAFTQAKVANLASDLAAKAGVDKVPAFHFAGGTADDTAAAQAVFTAATAVGGEVVLSGVTTISAPLEYGSNVTISGKDRLAQLKAKTGLAGAFIMLRPVAAGVTDATIRNLIIDQRSDAYAAAINAQAVSIDKTVRATVEGCTFRNVMTMAVWCDSTSTDPCVSPTIRNNRIVSSIYGGFSLFGTVTDASISGNKITNTGDDAIAVQSSAAGRPNGVSITDNIIRACVLRGGGTATPHGILVQGSLNATISDNVIVGGTVSGGIRVLGQGTNVPEHTTITGNTIDEAGITAESTVGLQGSGINVTGVSAALPALDTTIHGNTVTRSRTAGIRLVNCAGLSVDGVTTKNGASGARIQGCTNGTIRGVFLDNGSSAVEPYGVLLISVSASERCSDLDVNVRSGDTRSGASRTQTHGILVSGSDNVRCTLRGNLTNNLTAPLGGLATGTLRYDIIGGGTPAIAAGAAAGTGATASVVGDDRAGVITINTGTGTGVGTVATLTFNFPYAAAPVVGLTARSAQAVESLSALYVVPTATTAVISSTSAPPVSQTLTLQYFVQPASA